MPYLFRLDGKKYACWEVDSKSTGIIKYVGSNISGGAIIPSAYDNPGAITSLKFDDFPRVPDEMQYQLYSATRSQYRSRWGMFQATQGNSWGGTSPSTADGAQAGLVIDLSECNIDSVTKKITTKDSSSAVLYSCDIIPKDAEIGTKIPNATGSINLSGQNIQVYLDTLEWVKKFEPDDNDPFGPGGTTGDGGGGGDFDNTSTPIDIPPLPSISASSTGFISLFNPTLSQLKELASYMWSDLFNIDGWKKLFADPMDAILGLSILPVSVPTGGAREVKVGNISTGISVNVAASQFVEVDCGSIDVNEYWGAYLDYEPYTQAQIFLPYIGARPISVDEIMGKTVRVVYHVDILTGACCCFVKCGDSVLYTYNGQCSIPIPINSANYTNVVNGVISIAASVGSLVASGGASAPTAIPAIASSVVNQMKPQIEKSGSVSGPAGVLNMQIPYLILIRPRQALPSKQNKFIGYPSLTTVQLTELSGYTEVQSVHLENIPATQEELAEIESLLEGGVIF